MVTPPLDGFVINRVTSRVLMVRLDLCSASWDKKLKNALPSHCETRPKGLEGEPTLDCDAEQLAIDTALLRGR